MEIEFEPTYMQEFSIYLIVRSLLTHSLCAIDLRSKGVKDSPIIDLAREELRSLISDLNSPEARVLLKIKRDLGHAETLDDLKGYLERILKLLESDDVYDSTEFKKAYQEIKDSIKKLAELNKELEGKVFAILSRPIRSYQI